MRFYSRKLVKPEDMNPYGTLFGGSVLAWVDEEAAIFVACQLGKQSVVTKYMSEIDFVSSARMGDIIEIGMETVSLGKTSITIRCEVRHKFSHDIIISIEKIVFVHVDGQGRPTPHGVTSILDPEDQSWYSQRIMIIKIETIRELLMGQESYIEEFSEASISSFREFSTEYAKQMKERNMEKLKRAGHKIKPVAQMLQVEEVIEEYENGKRILNTESPDDQEIEMSIERIQNLCDRIIGQFEEIIRTAAS